MLNEPGDAPCAVWPDFTGYRLLPTGYRLPPYWFLTTNSTRRFIAMPSGVSFDAIGRDSP